MTDKSTSCVSMTLLQEDVEALARRLFTPCFGCSLGTVNGGQPQDSYHGALSPLDWLSIFRARGNPTSLLLVC